MLDISRLSDRYTLRKMTDSDADAILDLCLQNGQFYRYCGKQPSRALVLDDLHIAPPGIGLSDKYYVGFYDDAELIAVMDLIDGYPDADRCFIGFFMMNKRYQGRGIGSEIVDGVCRYLKSVGFTAVRLAIDKYNPQSNHFWRKNGFVVIKEVQREGQPILVAEKTL